MNSPNLTTVPLPPARGRSIGRNRADRALGRCPQGPAAASKLGKFEAHKWGGFTARLELQLHSDLSRALTQELCNPPNLGDVLYANFRKDVAMQQEHYCTAQFSLPCHSVADASFSVPWALRVNARPGSFGQTILAKPIENRRSAQPKKQSRCNLKRRKHGRSG